MNRVNTTSQSNGYHNAFSTRELPGEIPDGALLPGVHLESGYKTEKPLRQQWRPWLIIQKLATMGCIALVT